MRGRLIKEGDYEVFQTSRGHRILALDQEQWFAVVEGQKSDILVKSDSDHEKESTVRKGTYYYADFKDDPAFQDQPHLFMEEGNHFCEYVLPQGLPRKKGGKVRLVRTGKPLSRKKVLDHVKGRGNRGSEKQYEGKPEGLRSRSKGELYDMAKQKGIEGRSKMNKEDLVHALVDKS